MARRREELIRFFHMEKRSGENRIIRRTDLILYDGEITGILGDAESGVEELCHILAGETEISSGEMFFKGQKILAGRRQSPELRGIYRIHPGSRLSEGLDAAENLCLYGPVRFVPPSERLLVKQKNIHLLAQEYMDEWELGISSRTMPSDMKPIQRFVLLLIRALMSNPELLILDHVCEAAAEADYPLMEKLLERVRTPMVIAENRPELLYRYVDRILVMREGSVTGDYFRGECSPGGIVSLLTGGKIRAWRESRAETGFAAEPEMRKFVFRLRNRRIVCFPGKAVAVRGEGIPAKTWQRELTALEDGQGRLPAWEWIPGEEADFGLFRGLTLAENLSFRILKKEAGRGGFLPERMLEYAWRENLSEEAGERDEGRLLPGQRLRGGSWKNRDPRQETESLPASEKLQLAIRACRTTGPDVIFLWGLGKGFDWEHLQLVAEEIRRLCREGLALVLVDPSYDIARSCCGETEEERGEEA